MLAPSTYVSSSVTVWVVCSVSCRVVWKLEYTVVGVLQRGQLPIIDCGPRVSTYVLVSVVVTIFVTYTGYGVMVTVVVDVVVLTTVDITG